MDATLDEKGFVVEQPAANKEQTPAASPDRASARKLRRQGVTNGQILYRRPIFAWVIAIIIMLGGALAIQPLSIAQYPEIAPTTVRISATYTGASAAKRFRSR